MSEWISAQGGLVGLGVLLAKYGLILFSALALAVVVERVLFLRRLQRAEAKDFPYLREALARRQLNLVRAHLVTEGGPSGAILNAALENQDDGEIRMREVMGLETEAQIAHLQWNLPILATAASTAPYIGLFGTVLGILAAFREIAQTGQTGPSVVAGGISEALTATALGLGVAIPSVMAYNFFTGWVNKLSLELETHSLDLATLLPAAIVWEREQSAKVGQLRTESPRAMPASRGMELGRDLGASRIGIPNPAADPNGVAAPTRSADFNQVAEPGRSVEANDAY